jgi:hypothetical protein
MTTSVMDSVIAIERLKKASFNAKNHKLCSKRGSNVSAGNNKSNNKKPVTKTINIKNMSFFLVNI